MNVKRAELLKALKHCLPGIESGTAVLEGADLFVFKGGFVHSYNDLISVSVPVKADGLLEEEIDGAVRAEEFFSIISKFTGDLIAFEPDKDKWILKSGRAKVELTLMAGDFSDRLNNIAPDKKKWLPISTEFAQGMGICRMVNNKNAISGFYVTSKDIMSSDGYQVNRFTYQGPDIEPFWISDASGAELLKVGALNSIQIKGTWAHFKAADGTVFSVKTLQAEKWPYEKLSTVLDSHKKVKGGLSAVFPKELFEAINRAASFFMDISDTKAVRLGISPKGIKVSAERAAGKFTETVDWKEAIPTFEPFELYVDTTMMLFAARRSLAFYIHEGSSGAPRMVFTTQNSLHLMSTLSRDEVSAQEKVDKSKKKKEEEKEVEIDTPPAKEKAKAKKKPEPEPEPKDDEEEDEEEEDDDSDDEEEVEGDEYDDLDDEEDE